MADSIQGPVVVLTGAGVSAESGIPTFRGKGGLWRNFRPQELATPAAFRRDPASNSRFGKRCQVVVIGTSAVVHPAASLPLVALRNGARLVEVNPAETPLSEHAHEILRGPVAELLPGCWKTQSHSRKPG